MSAGYAARLKEYPNKGVCGLPEVCETKRSFGSKMQRLCELVKQSKRIVVVTGAGISTAAGIPDFRGPKGIWTLEKKSKKRKRDTAQQEDGPKMEFSLAKPTFTHRAITFLIEKQVARFCITQNVDGLHRRSGLSRERHAVLHGCAFTETCEHCKTEHFRDYDIGGMSFQKTGRKCEKCGGDLKDTLLDWEDPLPDDDLDRSTEECEQADLVLALGTSLRIEPAGSLPTMARKFVIVNLQETPKDSLAHMIIRARVDDVMEVLLQQLGYHDWEKSVTKQSIERLWAPSADRKRD